MTLLFLDTEWADLEGEELVSLALLSEDGSRCFYAEREPLPLNATPFVRDNVMPLLDRGNVARKDADFTRELRRFIASIPSPEVIFDYGNDGRLLDMALRGFACLPSELDGCAPLPQVPKKHLLTDRRISEEIESIFLESPERDRRRHHAMNDAEVLREAWLRVHRGSPSP